MRITDSQRPNKEYLTNDPEDTLPEATAARLFEGVVRSRERIVRRLFGAVTEAFAEAGIAARTGSINTRMVEEAFATHLSSRTLHDLIKEEGVALPAYCASWKEVAWRLVQQLLAFGYGERDTLDNNPLFDIRVWINQFIEVPEKIIRNQGNLKNKP